MESRKRRRHSDSSSESENDEAKRTLFVANLHSKITDEIFYELFLQAGPIESVSIPKDKETNRQKTFGFVTYKYKCAVPYAINLYDGIKLFGQRLTIKAREARENRDSFNSNANRDSFNSRNSSLRHGFSNNQPLDLTAQINAINRNNELRNVELALENLTRFAPQLVEGIRGSFENPFQPSSSKYLDRHQSNYKHTSRNESRHSNRDKPYQRHNSEKHKYHSHKDNRKSDQRRNR